MDMHDPAHPSEVLTGWLDDLGLSVTAFAKHLGVSRVMLSRHASKLGKQLLRLDLAKSPVDMNAPGWNLHQLSTGHWSIWVNGNWRMTFDFDGENAILIDYQDYH